MSSTYLVRAKLDGSQKPLLTGPHQLPVKFGKFKLDWSPNFERLLFKLGLTEPDPEEGLAREDKAYPVSLLYLDFEMDVGNRQQPHQVADETLAQLQALMRLFQAGDVCLRRHTMGEPLEQSPRGNAPTLEDLFSPCPEPEPTPLYERTEYKLDDETLARFIEFFDFNWPIPSKRLPSLSTAISRFSSSYEKRTLADRLLDLMIAMEALFGDHQGELAYKISLRSACLLYKPGEARKRAFETVKKWYGDRSKLVHGKSLTSKHDNEETGRFEEYVRKSIVKLLDLYRVDTSTTQLDDLLFFKQPDDPEF